ncbi:MAG: hypothetical protein ACYDGR_06735 [Candidatus Dormibacteria bacterium]
MQVSSRVVALRREGNALRVIADQVGLSAPGVWKLLQRARSEGVDVGLPNGGTRVPWGRSLTAARSRAQARTAASRSRNALIVARRAEGRTLSAIGSEFGLSRQRVAQVLDLELGIAE